VETYPVLALIALGWTLPGARSTGRLPKYNPQRSKTFSVSDWRHLCGLIEQALRKHGLPVHADWVTKAAQSTSPRKGDQDKLDACLCLLTAVHLAAGRELLMVGEMDSGTMVVPFGHPLHEELKTRCEATGRPPSHWVRRLVVTRQ
jgi:predicted RNase H-like nuclease